MVQPHRSTPRVGDVLAAAVDRPMELDQVPVRISQRDRIARSSIDLPRFGANAMRLDRAHDFLEPALVRQLQPEVVKIISLAQLERVVAQALTKADR